GDRPAGLLGDQRQIGHTTGGAARHAAAAEFLGNQQAGPAEFGGAAPPVGVEGDAVVVEFAYPRQGRFLLQEGLCGRCEEQPLRGCDVGHGQAGISSAGTFGLCTFLFSTPNSSIRLAPMTFRIPSSSRPCSSSSSTSRIGSASPSGCGQSEPKITRSMPMRSAISLKLSSQNGATYTHRLNASMGSSANSCGIFL